MLSIFRSQRKKACNFPKVPIANGHIYMILKIEKKVERNNVNELNANTVIACPLTKLELS